MKGLDRRRFLTGGAALASSLVLPAWANALETTATRGDWRLAFADLEEDLAPAPMVRVHGSAPAELSGRLYRNGPAKFHRPGGSATHWFDGDGLVRLFSLESGSARLAARFVDTPKRRADAAAGAVVSGGFGTAPAAGLEIDSPDAVNAANTSLVMRGGELWALWEAGSPMSIDPDSLQTRGFKTFRSDLEHLPFLAHPRVDGSGRLWNLGQLRDQAVIWQVAPSGELLSALPLALPRASYIHDFTATERHLIIILQPWVQREGAATPVIAAMDWQPQTGTLVLVIDKSDPSRQRTYELPAFFFFHVGDAWENRDGSLQFDVCRYPDPTFATETARTVLVGDYRSYAHATLALVTLDANGAARLADTGIDAEFPRIDARRAGLPRSKTLHVTRRTESGPLYRGVAVHDWTRGRSQSFDFGPDHIVEEMVFVPRTPRSPEWDGWIVGPSLNLRAAATELHVFAAADVERGPLCTWRAPRALPVGFHGLFAA